MRSFSLLHSGLQRGTLPRGVAAVCAAVTSAALLASCSSADPTAEPGASESAGDSKTIVIGTANFPESEILGQLWAATLEDAGFDVEVKSGIGSREIYMKALEEGTVDIVPEYTGNLAQFYKAKLPSGADEQKVYEALEGVLPEALAAGAFAPAESKDAYHVTPEVAKKYKLASLADLKNLDEIKLAGNPELAERPYGPRGLSQTYGVDEDKFTMHAISDGGGPLTIAALLEGEANVADIYTTSPILDRDGKEVKLVRLEDPQSLVAPQNVVPVYRSADVPQKAVEALDKFDGNLKTEDLVAMNLRNSGNEKAEPAAIARDFIDAS
ncbi:glycine betaine ABC transporter substrate-binding protein [Corynebacterium striatum]|uniref:glycine betaine ABC transporter substrate-binding protein n=1 Tax=Corynebacterium striatum TaxID=43770 RepID=UPI000C3A2E33|nr:ABC transporter substrate-binding protein [Corynebacterium striatum]PIS67121.1 ABC transporter substrate-binding protein [Corynebacterium striatum]PXY15931.1 ABC transporter substrate-binding protein [Corynebacterium striatum]QQU78934.1 ABC transporter substrate-binding protein [Corynebacterium striatum]GKH17998.1 glycine/betaine ABC transporter permease [Corynebacterium striatum]